MRNSFRVQNVGDRRKWEAWEICFHTHATRAAQAEFDSAVEFRARLPSGRTAVLARMRARKYVWLRVINLMASLQCLTRPMLSFAQSEHAKSN